MALPIPKLDSRTWDELVVEGRSLLGRFAPEWTDHNLHDPGITLLELYAWLTELLLHRADRVSPAMQRAFLRLAGVTPAPARTAQTVVTASGGPLAAGTVLVDAAGTALYETTRALEPSAARLVAVAVAADGTRVDRTADNGRGFPPFGRSAAAGDALLLGFDALPAAPGAELSLYAWSPTWTGDAARRDVLAADPSWPRHYGVETAWEYPLADGSWAALDAGDETRALSLSGPVRIAGPVDHAPDAATGLWWIRCRIAAGAFDCAPSLLAIAAHAVTAVHAVAAPVPEPLGATRGEPRRRMALRRRPVVAASTALRLTLADGTVELDWREVAEWDEVGSDDRCYRLDAATGTIELGDGRHGRVPPAGTLVEATAYRVGGGAAGNVRAGTLVATADGAEVAQPYPAGGGADAEPLAAAHGRALDALERPARAVTTSDAERLARATPGVPVGRARAIGAHHPDFPGLVAPGCLTVVVVPACGRAPGPAFVEAVRRHLEPRRPLTVELHVVAPELAHVDVGATLVVAPGASPDAAASAEASLRAYFDPIAGGPDGTGWPFGRDVLESEVLAVLASAAGVRWVEDLRLARAGSAASCGNLAICPTGLVEIGAVTLTVTEETRP